MAALQSPEIAKNGAQSGDFMKWRKPAQSTPPAGAMPLRRMLNPQHSLYLLAEAINWQVFDEQFGPLYAEGIGRPALSTRWTSPPGPSSGTSRCGPMTTGRWVAIRRIRRAACGSYRKAPGAPSRRGLGRPGGFSSSYTARSATWPRRSAAQAKRTSSAASAAGRRNPRPAASRRGSIALP